MVAEICTRQSDPGNDMFVIQSAQAFAERYFMGKHRLVVQAARVEGFAG